MCHELIDLLDKETKTKGPVAAVNSRIYGAGGAALLRTAEDILVTQAVLGQAVTPEDAREQVKALVELVRKLGTVDQEVVYEAKQFRYDVRWKMGK